MNYGNIIRWWQARIILLVEDEAGMSTVEYAIGTLFIWMSQAFVTTRYDRWPGK